MLRSSAAERNKEPILQVLRNVLPSSASDVRALEVASGEQEMNDTKIRPIHQA